MQRWAKHFKCVEPHVSVILVSLGVHRPYLLGLICRSHASRYQLFCKWCTQLLYKYEIL